VEKTIRTANIPGLKMKEPAIWMLVHFTSKMVDLTGTKSNRYSPQHPLWFSSKPLLFLSALS
jgi:hypothetical protein